jgi:DNA-binding NarL/FixJ family response regulator
VMAEFVRLSRPTRPPNAGLAEPLSPRELEILALLAHGLSNREIAQRLFLAEGTVKNYVTTIFQKIGVRDRTQAALRGRELGLL